MVERASLLSLPTWPQITGAMVMKDSHGMTVNASVRYLPQWGGGSPAERTTLLMLRARIIPLAKQRLKAHGQRITLLLHGQQLQF